MSIQRLGPRYYSREYKERTEERANPLRVTGIVGKYFGNYSKGDRHTWFVKDDKDQRYWFNNYMEHNPYRGLGSNQYTYFFDINDRDKTMPYMSVMNTPDNNTNSEIVGIMFEEGLHVTFVPKKASELQCNDNGAVIMYIQTFAGETSTHYFNVPNGCNGLACDVALNTDANVPAWNKLAPSFLPRLPPSTDVERFKRFKRA